VGQPIRASDSRKPAGLIAFGRSRGLLEALQSLFFGAVVGLLTAEVVIQADVLAPGGRLPDPLRCDGNGGVLRRDALYCAKRSCIVHSLVVDPTLTTLTPRSMSPHLSDVSSI
jgi:hypothetical protein